MKGCILVNIVGERERPNLDLPAMFGLHNVPSAHSFPFVKQDRSTCRCYMRIAHWQNGTYLTLSARQSPGSLHAAVCARAILAYLQVAGTMKIGKRYIQPRLVTESCSACRRSNGGDSRWLDHYREARVLKHLVG